MSSPSRVSVGIDFGTSNTVVALAGPDGPAHVVRFDHRGVEMTTFMSALCWWHERIDGVNTKRFDGGPWAVDAFLTAVTDLRFIQSFKTFAGSASFKDTIVFGERMDYPALMATFLGTVRRHSGLDTEGARVVMGRPVRFAGGNPDEGLAMARYREATARLGVDDPAFVYEPVGAAFHYARALEGDATILVADFGGGTTDFSVLRFGRKGGRRVATPLGHAGIGIAGDTFDYRFLDRVVSPRLGKGSDYLSFGKSLTVPGHFYANFARWNQLSMMKANGDLKELRQLAKSAVAREALERFIEIVEYDLGFALYQAVSAAKRELSQSEAAEFVFAQGGIDIRARVTRAEFESWIADDVAQVEATLDAALSRAQVRPDGIDRVFLTGGTSFVPAIRRLFRQRFGDKRPVSGDEFESIAAGLALIGREPDLDGWTVGSVPSSGH
ncbi:Hsp70 family protein [Alsobacter sp. R-9]